jgi:uncharacterized membrane protein
MSRVATESQVSIEDAEWENPANWHAGVLNLYFSRRDSRPFVPKRGTVVGGATINFARPAGWGLLVGIALFVALVFILNRTDWLTR